MPFIMLILLFISFLVILLLNYKRDSKIIKYSFIVYGVIYL